MARIGDELLEKDAVVAKARFCFRPCSREILRHLGLGKGDAHAFAAAAGGGLDHDRVADLFGNGDRLVGILDHAEMAGNRRDVGAGGGLLQLDLVAHGGDRLSVRPDEDDPRLGQRLRERGAFGEKAIAWMHRLGAALLAGGHDLVDDQVALRGGRRADGDGGVGHFHMQRIAVGLGIDRDGFDAHAARGFDDPAGDLAAIGNQDSLEHRRTLSCPAERGRGHRRPIAAVASRTRREASLWRSAVEGPFGLNASSTAACPLHHASHGPPPPLRFTARWRIKRNRSRDALRARVLRTTTPKKDLPPATKGRRSAERRNPTIGRAAPTSVAADRCPGAAARHNGGAPAFRRFTAALARPNASSLGSAPEPGFPTSRARGCFARLHPSVG